MAFQQYRVSQHNEFPPVIKNLIIINCLMLFARTQIDIKYDNWFSNTFALFSFDSKNFMPWQIITHMFMHFDMQHLLFNMVGLWFFGRKLEILWGSKRFLGFYFFAGLGATVLSISIAAFTNHLLLADIQSFLAQPNAEHFASFLKSHSPISSMSSQVFQVLDEWRNEPKNPGYVNFAMQYIDFVKSTVPQTISMGASGAVFGVLAAFGYLFPNTELMTLIPIPIKAKYLILGYAATEIYLGYKNSAGDNVAHWAHIGGALFGFLLVFYWNKKNRKTFY
jgi:membrane associated rhomboid family serine protease